MKKYTFIKAIALSAALSGNVLAGLNDGLVAYYPFNGNAKDESGNGNDGTVHGATLTEDRFGNKESAYSFDGKDDYIEIANSPSLNITKELTLVAWVKPIKYETTNSEYKTIIWGQTAYYLAINKDKKSLANYRYGMTNPGYHFTSDNTVPIGKETHIAAVWNGNTLKQFINGSLVQTISNVSGIATGTTGFISIATGNSNRAFNGKIDDVRIYNRALSESEIQQLYATTLETNISPQDSGTITKSPDKTSYSPNEEVTLIAKPAKGYKFKQWQGDTSGSETTITIKMNGDQSVTAIFEEKEEEKPPIEISSKASYDSSTNTLYLEGILVPFINEFTGKETDNKGIFDAQLQEKTKLVFELTSWNVNFKSMFEGEDTSGYILYHHKTRTFDIPCFKVTTIAKLGDGIEGKAIYYKNLTMKQRHIKYQIFHVENMTETDSCN